MSDLVHTTDTNRLPPGLILIFGPIYYLYGYATISFPRLLGRR